ncbi:MAG: hypothetical protein BZY88_04020 [SAR202 cluster bacterium Io17-Chloro-G9]|nr:MAG: hypothetical protein BZY88_04020 [SAR202 cluster bacterium Io17-Chloro-G9]
MTTPSWAPRLHTLDSWRAYPNYRLLWLGDFCANSAQWIQLLTVGWLVRDLTAADSSSGLLVVTVGGISTLPVLVVGPWAGVLGDRLDRRRVVMATQTIMAFAALSFALMVRLEWVDWGHAYAYVLLGGASASITLPMRQALIANTVPPEAYANAYAANALTITASRIVGPFAGGLLITTLGFSWNFTVEAALYAAAALSILPMKTPYRQPAPTAKVASPLASLKEGLRYIWSRERVIFYLIMVGLIPNVVLHPVWFLLPVFTTEVLDRSADVGGYLLAATGFGGMLAALVIASVGFIFKKGVVCLAAILVSAVCVILFAYAPWLAAALILMVAMSFAQATFRTGSSTLVQLLTPDTLRARVTSLTQYNIGFVVLSSLAIGWLVDLTSVSVAIAVVGIAGLVLGLTAWLTLAVVHDLE